MISYNCDKCKDQIDSEMHYKSNVVEIKGFNEYLGTRGECKRLHLCKKCFNDFWKKLSEETDD